MVFLPRKKQICAKYGEQKSRKSKIGENDLKQPQTITGVHIKGFWIDSNGITYHMVTTITGQNPKRAYFYDIWDIFY